MDNLINHYNERYGNPNIIKILQNIESAAKDISYHIKQAALLGITGYYNTYNTYGDKQAKLDILADNIICRALIQSGQINSIASEELNTTSMPGSEDGEYCACIDPLDGSSNIDVNVGIGTIFSIYRGTNVNSPGNKQILAGYIIYGPCTMFVYTVGRGTHGFTLDNNRGEFILTHNYIMTPEKGHYVSINESNYYKWHQGIQNYTNWLKKQKSGTEDYRNSRYVGSLVCDFHRNLIKGGIFIYPGDTTDKQKGKLRLQFEANPLAFIIEQAGGFAIDGDRHILDITPSHVHEIVPLIIGSKYDVDIVKQFIDGKR